MKYWLPVNWSENFGRDGLLFFVQRIQEMLFHFSSEIDRVPVHNTSTLLYEFLSTYKQVKKGVIGSYQLFTIFEELRNSFSEDKILRDYLGEETMGILSDQLNHCREEDYLNMVYYIADIVTPKYLEWSVNYLKKHISVQNHKEEIEKGIRCWISEIIMRGYSAEFIYNYVEDCLVRRSISSIDDMNAFFERFNFKKRKYKVYLQIEASMKDYLSVLERRLSLLFKDDGNFSRIDKKENKILCYFEFEELDHYTAIVHAYQKINIFFKYFRFISNTRKYLLYKFGAVLDCETNHMYFLPVIPTGFKSIEIQRDNIHIETIDSIILGVQNGHGDGAAKLDKAITLHNSAIRQQLPKDGFINLWSILEVLCPQENGKSKLQPILNAILPIMQNDYFATVFETIATDLKDNLLEEDYQFLLETIPAPSIIMKIAYFCILPEYEHLREEYFEKMHNLPLLRNKIYGLYKLRNNKKDFFALSKKYRKRVEWHLYRLYRTRNSIVHAGVVPNRVQVLGEHLHSYVDSIMLEIAGKLSMQRLLKTVDSVFVDTRLLVRKKEQLFSIEESISQEDLHELFNNFFVSIHKD
ncbi:hypothetical protein [Anaerotignum sp.]|uniref:hypothetical protein n=1 Tax=Anaerotignum sp. TaxID=2039241 RepID=UPI002A90D505|nr:hypothetical protein [Anaerotignum sp.]MCI7188726.1 hypothetical protein [Fusobacterium mortiferum]MCI7658212.1 hypothetical protein [Clostridia bacterium]MDY5415246.1 hypothetical protein [Anaerotignum sp.]